MSGDRKKLTNNGPSKKSVDKHSIYIAEAGYAVLEGCLLERPAYRKAQNTGHAVTETSFRNLNSKADALIQTLIDRVGEGGNHG